METPSTSRGGTRGARGQRGARGRGGGASRGRGGGRRGAFNGSLTDPSAPPPSSSPARNGDDDEANEPSAVPSAPTKTVNGQEEAATEPPPPDADLCFICAEPVTLYSVGECNHRTCHVCAIRLRALYKNTVCTFCKNPMSRVIFTPSPDKLFSAFLPSETPFSDPKLSISFETREAMEDTLILLRFNCPDPKCEFAAAGWSDLRLHAKREHQRLICDLCVRHKKIFAHEHTLYTNASLSAHVKDDHRLCEYCRETYYSDDELFEHLRDRHEQCHMCVRNGTGRWQYYRDYNMLEKHFKNDHYLCLAQDCLDKKFVVFETEIDFKAHQVQDHGAELSSSARRDAMRVETNFSYADREPGPSSRRGGRGGRAGGRGGTRGAPQDEPHGPQFVTENPGPSTRVVPGAAPGQGQGRRAHFGGMLTSPSPSGAVTPSAQEERSTSTTTAQANGDGGAQNAAVERHQEYLARVKSVLNGSDSKLASFRSAVKTFRASEMSARDLVHTIHSLVGDLDASAGVVNGLVDLFEEEDKKTDVLAAWNGFRIEQTQFPSLVAGSGYADASLGSRQVQNVKRNTNAGASGSGGRVWANVERAASASGGHGAGAPTALRPSVSRQQAFPALSASSASTATRGVGGKVVPGSTAWSTSARNPPTSSSSSSSFQFSVPAPGGTTSSSSFAPASSSSSAAARVTRRGPPPRATASNFPALPSSSTQAALNAERRALLGQPSRPNPVSSWGPSPAEASGRSNGGGTPTATEETGTGGRKKGKKKQILFTMGAVEGLS